MVQFERKDNQTVILIKMPLKYLITFFFLRCPWSCENIQFSSRERLHFFCAMPCGRRYIILVHFSLFWVYLVWRSSCFVAVQMDFSTPSQWVFSVEWHYKRKGLRCLYHECTLDLSKKGFFQNHTRAYYMWFASICVLVNSNACHRKGEEHGTSAT